MHPFGRFVLLFVALLAPEKKARALLDELVKGDFAAAESGFDDRMKAALPEEKLRTAFTSLTTAAGSFQAVKSASEQTQGEHQIVDLTSQFERSAVNVRVVFDKDGKVAGLFFRPIEGASSNAEREAAAKEFVEKLAKADFSGAEATMAPQMAAAMPRERMAQLWSGLELNFGHFQQVKREKSLPPSEGFFPTLVASEFERGVNTFKVVLDGRNHVAGLFILEGDATIDFTPPPYAKPDRFTERKLSVGPFHLPGKLLVPKGDGPFPAVVLVHGSGPQDEDETVGGTKVFVDLAEGLASRGIAVLRYPKRTRIAPQGVKTVKEEVIDDVAAAVAALQKEPGIDPRRVFIVGHSLGAYLGPWLARDVKDVRGVAMLAPAARPIMDLVVDQLQYFASLRPNDKNAAQEAQDAKAWRERTLATDLKPDEEVFHAKGEYWLALRGYDPVKLATTETLPMFIAQGGRDYQVSPKLDYGAFEKALAGKKNVTFESYPSLNHLFVAGKGRSTPDEYEVPGHVDVKVVEDLASWIAAH